MRARFPRLRETVRDRFARIAIPLFFVFGPAACAHGDPNLAVALATSSPDAHVARAQALASIYAAAKRSDETTLLDMQRKAGHDPDPAVTLALLTIDRTRYAEAFVRTYPSVRDVLTFDYGSAFAAARVVRNGARFPVAALGAIAVGGDRDALAKLLGGAAALDGPLGDAYRAEARHVIAAANAETVLDAFAELPPAERYAAISAVDWCALHPTAILAFQPTPPPAVPSAAPSPHPSATATPGTTPLAGSAAPSPAPAATASTSPDATPSVVRHGPSLADVTSLQAAIDHAATLDCRIARSTRAEQARVKPIVRARTASPRKPSPAPHIR